MWTLMCLQFFSGSSVETTGQLLTQLMGDEALILTVDKKSRLIQYQNGRRGVATRGAHSSDHPVRLVQEVDWAGLAVRKWVHISSQTSVTWWFNEHHQKSIQPFVVTYSGALEKISNSFDSTQDFENWYFSELWEHIMVTSRIKMIGIHWEELRASTSSPDSHSSHYISFLVNSYTSAQFR